MYLLYVCTYCINVTMYVCMYVWVLISLNIWRLLSPFIIVFIYQDRIIPDLVGRLRETIRMYSCLKRRPIAALEEAIVSIGKKKKKTVEEKGNLTRRTANPELEMLHTKYSLHMYTYIHCISRRWAVRPGVPLGRGCPGRHRIGAAAHAATYTQRSILYAYIDGGMYPCMYVCMWVL